MKIQGNEILRAKPAEKHCIQETDDLPSRYYHTIHHTNYPVVGEQVLSPNYLLSEFYFEEDVMQKLKL